MSGADGRRPDVERDEEDLELGFEEMPRLPVPRRGTGSERAQLRAALALEEAGELQEAARMFEYVGEHAQAASLRLEHADTLRDRRQRLAVLREGCVRNPANSEQGRALHRALGEALLEAAADLEPGARRRALLLEAAEALHQGERGELGGRIFEELGMRQRALEAYTEAGDIDGLERVHASLEVQARVQRSQRAVELEIEAAMRTGQRQLAYTLLLEHTRDPHAARPGQAPSGLDEGTSGVGEVSSTALVAARHDIERRLLRGRALGLLARELEPSERHGAPTALRIFGRERLRLGRGPECELPARGAALSRTHAELLPQRPQPDEDSVLVLRDLASRAGTFIDGQALAPGEPWPLHPYGDEPLFAELGLGIAASFELWTLPDPAHPSALVRDARFSGEPSEGLERAWTLFAPHGGPLWLHPERRLPLSLRFAEDHVVLTASPEIQITLDHTPVGAGVSVELLVGDRLRVEGRGMGAGVELEILEVWS